LLCWICGGFPHPPGMVVYKRECGLAGGAGKLAVAEVSRYALSIVV